ncbi:MAG: PQQ-like beta-propeller repeat protein, partial [Planctomycetes bacterium]|nr:PQQ-like beta-propeller repeat protein [Planctomycetota bacterium]
MIGLRMIRTMVALACVGGFFLATGCGVLGGGKADTSQDFVPSIVEDRDADFYVRQLQELPMRFFEEGRWHISLRPNHSGADKPAVREMYLLRDPDAAVAVREPRPSDAERIAGWNARRNEANKRDTILIVFDDSTLISIAARTFTVNWVSALKKRVKYMPVMTEESIFFIDEFGEFQRIDRYTGEVTDIDKFGTGFFPNAQPAANNSHIIIPTTNSNAVEGRPDDDASNTINPLVWRFPSSQTGSVSDFGMVQSQPIADQNNIYLVSDNNHLYCLRASDGLMIWDVKLETVGIVRTRPSLLDGVIYVGSDTQLMAISLEGQVLATFTPGPGEVFEGEIYAMDSQVFVRTAKIVDGDESNSRNRNLRYGLTTQETP